MTERPEEEVATELMHRIEAASSRRLGDMATVMGGVDLSEEVDDFPYDDAATWSPEILPDYTTPDLSDEEREELFQDPDEQMGTVEDWGWHGLVRHEGRPGGYILVEDDQGFREVREFEETEGLESQWQRLTETYERWVEERDSYEAATQEPVPGHSGLAPRVYIASLSDYNAGRLLGMWADATLDADTLGAAVRFMLRQSHEDVAEEVAIHDHEDFDGYEVREYDSLATVSRIAQGIAEYGEAFAHWATHVGADDSEALDHFNDCYQGHYESTEAYVEEFLEETGAYRFLDAVPEDLRGYLSYDVEQIARDWESTLTIIEGSDGVYIFDNHS